MLFPLLDIFKNITHIFWDLDHTIWDYKTNARITIFELYAKHQIQNLTHHSPSVFHEVYCKHNDLAWEDYRKGIIDKTTLRQIRFKNTFMELGMKPEVIYEIFETEFVEICPTKGNLMPGAMKALTHFHLHFAQHIITNGFKETQSVKMQTSGIHHFFNTLTNSEDTGFQKPHPEIFKIALQSAGATPDNSMMIGDNYEADILGANALGMKCVFYNPESVPIENMSEDIVNIKELEELIKKN
ncbi:MAG: YjjG family noncanonical pyrimidine nucleotidase [Bacteroidia bacterium]